MSSWLEMFAKAYSANSEVILKHDEIWNEIPSHEKAAVLIVLFGHPENSSKRSLQCVLTVRSSSLRTFPGQSAFPGGRSDKEDKGDYWLTAFREAAEEIGLERSRCEILGTLPLYMSRNRLAVRPCVCYVPGALSMEDLHLKPSAAEVDAIFSVPLSRFSDTHDASVISWDGHPYIFHSLSTPFDVRTWQIVADYEPPSFQLITGLTAEIAVDLAELRIADGQAERITSWHNRGI